MTAKQQHPRGKQWRALALAGLLILAQSVAASSTGGFEKVSGGVYPAGAVIEGWSVLTNEVAVVADPKGAYDGTHYLALSSAHISKTFSTQPGMTYQFQFQAKGPGLTDWWPGEGNANDAVGPHKGTPKNIAFSNGKVALAFAFNGGNSEVDFDADAGNFGTNDFTIDFWIEQPPDATANYAVLEKRPECDALRSMWHIRCGPVVNWTPVPQPGQLDLELSDNQNAGLAQLVAHKAINDGNFHHAAFVRNGKVLEVYIDGTLDNSLRTEVIANIANSTVFRAGQNICVGVDATEPFVGELDELDLFSRALSPAEIYAIYSAGSDGKYGPVSTFRPNFQLAIDGALTNTIILNDAAGPWQLFTNSFTAKTSQTTVEFDGNTLGVLFDDIQLVPASGQ